MTRLDGAKTMLKSIVLAGVLLGAASGIALADEGIMPAPEGWGGYYAGLNGGYAQGTLTDGNKTFPDLTLTGAFVGGQAGYNFVLIGGLVAGIQGDVDWSFEKGSYGGPGVTIGTFDNATLTDTVKWTGAVTGRVGFAVGPVMAYGLGGFAVLGNTLQNLGVDQLQGKSPIEANITQTHYGWTAGGGLSAMVGQASAFLEYRYSSYGKADYSLAVGSAPVSLVDQQVRVGLNYHMQ